jgi:hypothetical protein
VFMKILAGWMHLITSESIHCECIMSALYRAASAEEEEEGRFTLSPSSLVRMIEQMQHVPLEKYKSNVVAIIEEIRSTIGGE